MTKQTKKPKQSRTRHTTAYKEEALALASRIGVREAAQQLGLHESQLYQWRANKQASDGVSDREKELAAEVARLKRQLADQTEELAIIKKAAAYFAKGQK